MKDGFLTLKQAADALGVSKDKVKYQARKLPEKYLCKNGGVTHIDPAGMALLRASLVGKTPKTTQEIPGEITHVIETLRQQLEAKDKQLADLGAALVAAQQSAAAAQALHAATVQRNLEEKNVEQRDRGFFGRLFGKRGHRPPQADEM